jgi:acid phosphatase (class A)
MKLSAPPPRRRENLVSPANETCHVPRTMKRPPFFLLLAALVLVAALPAGAAGTALHFLAPGAVDPQVVLPPPPAAGSLAARGDLETVLQVQASRTPAEVAWAKFIENDNVFNHATVLGAWFAKDKLPYTAEFFRQVTDDANAAVRGVKGAFARPRPPRTDPAVKPCVGVPESDSYPSGHSMRAYVWAAVLSDIFPEHQADLMARAHQAAWGRVIGGVHFPTDTIGGRIIAEAIVEAMRKSPAYRAAVEKCREEAAPFLLKEAA